MIQKGVTGIYRSIDLCAYSGGLVESNQSNYMKIKIKIKL